LNGSQTARPPLGIETSLSPFDADSSHASYAGLGGTTSCIPSVNSRFNVPSPSATPPAAFFLTTTTDLPALNGSSGLIVSSVAPSRRLNNPPILMRVSGKPSRNSSVIAQSIQHRDST